MSEIVAEHTDLSDADQRWLKVLVSEWQLLADLSFSDLVLWVPDRDENVFWAAAQIRPNTGPTALLLVGIVAPLLVGTYDRVEPRLFGFPFFYWYQLLWVFLAAAVCALSFWLLRRERLAYERRTGTGGQR